MASKRFMQISDACPLHSNAVGELVVAKATEKSNIDKGCVCVYSPCKPSVVVPKKEMVNHPDHYNSLGAKTPCGVHIECIDVIEHMPSNLASAVKYCWRKDHKGAPLQDLEKAVWYIKREIDRLKRLQNE